MKKLLLLSILCLFTQVKSEDVYSLETEADREYFKNRLRHHTLEDIASDVDQMFHTDTRTLRSTKAVDTLRLETSKVGVTCQAILNTLDLGLSKKQLQEFVPLCSLFYSKTTIALVDHPASINEKHELIMGLNTLQRKALELMRNN